MNHYMYKGVNISIKMLKDVGMTVPKSRETSVVYICSNTGNEGTIFTSSKNHFIKMNTNVGMA